MLPYTHSNLLIKIIMSAAWYKNSVCDKGVHKCIHKPIEMCTWVGAIELHFRPRWYIKNE